MTTFDPDSIAYVIRHREGELDRLIVWLERLLQRIDDLKERVRQWPAPGKG